MESQNLLSSKQGSSEEEWPMPIRKEPHRPSRWSYVAVIVASQVAIVWLSVTVTTLVLANLGSCDLGRQESPPYSPAAQVAYYSNVYHSTWNGDPYDRRWRGSPSPEVDAAWEELLEPYDLRITSEELEKLNKTSLQLQDGSGEYWGSMVVYHHLHCLRMIRHWMAPSYYGSDMKHEKMGILPGHIYPDHIGKYRRSAQQDPASDGIPRQNIA